jgi:hypothetical protein
MCVWASTTSPKVLLLCAARTARGKGTMKRASSTDHPRLRYMRPWEATYFLDHHSRCRLLEAAAAPRAVRAGDIGLQITVHSSWEFLMCQRRCMSRCADPCRSAARLIKVHCEQESLGGRWHKRQSRAQDGQSRGCCKSYQFHGFPPV